MWEEGVRIYGTPGVPNNFPTSTDINECENPNYCKLPGQKCINGLGNFTCSCIKGYHKDGSVGTCVTNQSSRPVTYTLLVGKYTYYTAP